MRSGQQAAQRVLHCPGHGALVAWPNTAVLRAGTATRRAQPARARTQGRGSLIHAPTRVTAGCRLLPSRPVPRTLHADGFTLAMICANRGRSSGLKMHHRGSRRVDVPLRDHCSIVRQRSAVITEARMDHRQAERHPRRGLRRPRSSARHHPGLPTPAPWRAALARPGLPPAFPRRRRLPCACLCAVSPIRRT